MSSFVVSARKYRPLKFEDVVGQDHVIQTLKNAILKDKLAHAFLFCGPRGVGKTSCARILAKTINCTNRNNSGEACNACDNCKTYIEQQTFNIIELDAASYNSVDHIRTLNDQVRFQPQQGQYKVFIIDEVHMLSQSAFNAFLKTLEEPPPYAVFILATTEKHKILPTILSRCQIFDFKRIPVPQIVNHLKNIAGQEHIIAEDEALHIIAQKSDGSLRDSLSIFDRLISFTDGSLSYQEVINNLNVLDYDYYFKIVESCLLEDFSNTFVLFDSIIKNGFEPDNFLLGLGEHLRLLLLCKDQRTYPLLEISKSLLKKYHEQSNLAPLSFLLTALQIINECDIHYLRAKNKRLHVEMALLKVNHIHKVVSKEITGSPSNLEKKTADEPDLEEVAHIFDLEEPKEKLKPLTIPADEVHPSLTSIEVVPVHKPKFEEKSPETVSQPMDRVKEAPNTQHDSPKSVDATSNLKTGSKIPKLGSLASIQSNILKNGNEKKNKIPFDHENIQNLWDEYTSNVSSKSLKKVLNDVELQIGNKRITAIVGTQFAKGVIVQESSLIEHLRYKTSLNDIQMVIEVDPNRAPEDLMGGSRIMTNKEKYELMCESNPLVEKMKDTFQLKVDHSV